VLVSYSYSEKFLQPNLDGWTWVSGTETLIVVPEHADLKIIQAQLNNRHWISDVLAGAGFGILSTNIAYATHRYKWGKKPGLVMLPTYSNGPGVFVSWRLE
jgi:hypothetical protein